MSAIWFVVVGGRWGGVKKKQKPSSAIEKKIQMKSHVIVVKIQFLM